MLLLLFTNAIYSQVTVNELKKLGTKRKVVLDSNGWKRKGIYTLNINQSSQTGSGAGSDNFLLGINSLLNKTVNHKKRK